MSLHETLLEKIKRSLRQSTIPSDIKASYLTILPYLPDDRIQSMMKKLEQEQLILNS